MFIKINSSSSHESHCDVIPSSYLTHFHTQSFIKISQVVIFNLSSCDSSPPLEPITAESSNNHKMTYTHPNLIPSVSMGSRRWEEEMGKDTFWYFWDDQLWPFNFQTNISKLEYLDFYSSDCKNEDSSGKLGIGRRHGQKPILRFLFFHLQKSLWLFTSPKVDHEPGTSENFFKHGFSFFNPNIPHSLETITKWKFCFLFHEKPHLNLKNQFWQKSKKISKANCKKPNLVCENWVLTKNTD